MALEIEAVSILMRCFVGIPYASPQEDERQRGVDVAIEWYLWYNETRCKGLKILPVSGIMKMS